MALPVSKIMAKTAFALANWAEYYSAAGSARRFGAAEGVIGFCGDAMFWAVAFLAQMARRIVLRTNKFARWKASGNDQLRSLPWYVQLRTLTRT
jgi:hypothetical protein